MKTGIQIMFLSLVLGITSPVPGQELVSLTNDDLLPWTDNGFYFSIDFTNTILADQSVGMNGIQLAYIYKHWLSAGLSYYSLPSSFTYKNHFYDLHYGGPIVQLMVQH
jgi:hypothetical protein